MHKMPILCCVALDRTNGQFEANLNSLQLIEGDDYFHFFNTKEENR